MPSTAPPADGSIEMLPPPPEYVMPSSNPAPRLARRNTQGDPYAHPVANVFSQSMRGFNQSIRAATDSLRSTDRAGLAGVSANRGSSCSCTVFSAYLWNILPIIFASMWVAKGPYGMVDVYYCTYEWQDDGSYR